MIEHLDPDDAPDDGRLICPNCGMHDAWESAADPGRFVAYCGSMWTADFAMIYPIGPACAVIAEVRMELALRKTGLIA